MNVGLLRKRGAGAKAVRLKTGDEETTVVRCAVYTRKSTEEGLEQEFNSLHAQREACENYTRSQASQGWQVLPELYDDGGFTGGNIERPALKRLMEDIQSGKVDCVLVYKVDRLSRSLIDFSRLMEVFQEHNVSFVSVTQQFSTASSGGRLFLNMLLSFAQYERELISERTRDKMQMARKRGKWTGGHQVLGYDLDSQTRKLVVNQEEAAVIRELFALYREQGSLLKVAHIAAKRGWANKSWVKRDGVLRVGPAFDKTGLHRLLTNPLYIGKTHADGELFPGEHEAIVDESLFNEVQEILERNSPNHSRPMATSTALLKGLIRCAPCKAAMVASSSRKGSRAYRYYVCTNAQKNGRAVCPHPYLPAQAIEDAVLDQVRGRLKGPKLLEAVVGELHRQAHAARQQISQDRKRLEKDRALLEETRTPTKQVQNRLASINERLAALAKEEQLLTQADFSPSRISHVLSCFEELWGSLHITEQQRLLGLLVEVISVDGAPGEVEIVFHTGEQPEQMSQQKPDQKLNQKQGKNLGQEQGGQT